MRYTKRDQICPNGAGQLISTSYTNLIYAFMRPQFLNFEQGYTELLRLNLTASLPTLPIYTDVADKYVRQKRTGTVATIISKPSYLALLALIMTRPEPELCQRA